MEYTIEDLRRFRATAEALDLLRDRKKPATKTELLRIKREVVKKVAAMIGETEATTRRGYIHPASWLILQESHVKTKPRTLEEKERFAADFLLRMAHHEEY